MQLWTSWRSNVNNQQIAEENRKTQRELDAQNREQRERHFEQRRELDQDLANRKIELEEKLAGMQRELDNLKIAQQEDFFERKKKLELELAQFNRDTQFELAARRRQEIEQDPESRKLFENWPLRVVPSQIIGFNNNSGSIPSRRPLTVLLSPPSVTYDRSMGKARKFSGIDLSLNDGLLDFINKHYSIHSQHPTNFINGAWDSRRIHGMASVLALYSKLKEEPLLILESEIGASHLVLRVGGWGIGMTRPHYGTVDRIPYWDAIDGHVRTQTREWRAKLKDRGLSPKSLKRMRPNLAANIEVLELEETLGTPDNEQPFINPGAYKADRKALDQFHQGLVKYHCLIAANAIDMYHLAFNLTAPRMPALLNELRRDVPPEIGKAMDYALGKMIADYTRIYENLIEESPSTEPELRIELALLLERLNDHEQAKRQAYRSLRSWASLKLGRSAANNELVDALVDSIHKTDSAYAEQIANTLDSLGDSDNAKRVRQKLEQARVKKLLSGA